MMGVEIFRDGDIECVIINDFNVEESIRFLEGNSEYGVHISRVRGFSGDSLNFLERASQSLQHIFIVDEICDISALALMKNLKTLVYSGVLPSGTIESLHSLVDLRFDWHSINEGLVLPDSVIKLSVSRFEAKNLQSFLRIPSGLLELRLYKPSVISLDGVGLLEGVRHLEVVRASKLTDLSAILEVVGSLEVLCLESCKRCMDVEVLKKLVGLRTLKLINCGEIDTLDPLLALDNLVRLNFLGTRIEDGKISKILSSKKIRYVGFDDKRHYDISWDEINKILRE